MILTYQKTSPYATFDRKTTGAAGYDLSAVEDVVVTDGSGTVLVNTGVRVAIPEGYVGLLTLRSGFAVKSGPIIRCVTNPGIIDSDYRGELRVPLATVAFDSYHIKAGDRIAQLVIVPCPNFQAVEADLDSTERGDGGFGSTGS